MSTISAGRWSGGSLPITDDDLLWAGRAAAGETSSAEGQIACLWTWLQRAAWLAEGPGNVYCRGSDPKPLTLTWVIRCHSAVVSEYWATQGDAARQARRARFQRAGWPELERESRGIKTRVYAWARGELANPVSGLVDFSEIGFHDVPAGALEIGGNAFFQNEAPSVTIGPPGPSPVIAKVFAALGVSALVAVAAWFALED